MRVSVPAFLAEVSDKMMSFPQLLLWNVGLIVAAWGLVRRSRWLVVIPPFVAAIFAVGMLEELRDPHIGPAMMHELGYPYVALSVLPFLAVAALLVRGRKPDEVHQNT